mmetsp:Transcript_3021/g.7123  ORF Transcript_3021/g.7123 Transcript_3021/m.7123 type:complete len:627 (-) Transcript_3021:575-2455(-)
MISRVAKQIEQDSDRHDDRSSSTIMGDTKPESNEIGTNKTLRDAQVPSANNSESNDATEKSCVRPALKPRQVRANNAHDGRKFDLGPSDSKKSSHYFYFPQNYQFPHHYSHIYYKSNQHRRNISYYHRRHYYPHHRPYPPQIYYGADHNMAPFDDTTLATSNISKKMENTGKRFLTVDTTLKDGMKQRSERYSRPHPLEYSTPRYNDYYHYPPHFFREDTSSRPLGHFEFYDSESGPDHEYPYSTTPIAITNTPPTPQRSNMSSGFGSRNLNGASEEDHAHQKSIDAAHGDNVPRPHSAPTHPPHEDRRQASYSSTYYHNGWHSAYEHTQEGYPPPEPYDRHYFSPSPPPPPPSPYPDYFVPSSESFSSRAASPSMSWYEGRQGSYDEHDVPVRAPVPHYYPNPMGGYHYPHPQPPQQEDRQRPGTPSSNEAVKRVPKVTPRKMSGRNSPSAINAEKPSSNGKAIVTPGDKNGASTFAPSSPFVSLRDSDIVCGRGAPTNFHVGNSRFRELVQDYNKDYFIAKRSDKPRIAMKVLDVLATRGARFVRRVKGGSSTSSHWEEVAHKIAYEKVCQALRDAGGPSRQMISSLASSALKRKSGNDNEGRNKRQKTAGGEEGKENCSGDQY